MQKNLQSGLSFIKIILILAIVAVILAVLNTFVSSSEPAEVSQMQENNAEMDSPLETMADGMAESMTEPVTQAVEAENAMIEAEMDAEVKMNTDTMYEPEAASAPVSAASAGTFETYSADKLALAADGTVVLFFHAAWCPSCRSLENDLNASLSDIPANTHIFKLDYDTETELKKKYGVVRQHTLVVVDANGNEVKKLTGLTNTLQQVANQL
jgi:thiol-disulfide isomerase/thioredoxin